MKNYYEILEVDKNASSEVIEKAYKALVKKYHPDLQPPEKKKLAEDKIKLINEAYDTLSNTEKKKAYDANLKQMQYEEDMKRQEQLKRNYQNNTQNNNNTYNRPNNAYANYQNNIPKRPIKNPNLNNVNTDNFVNDMNNLYNEQINQAYNNAIKKAYQDAYIQNLKNMGYEIKYERTLKDYFKIFLSLIFTIFFIIVLGFVLWHIPFTKNYFLDLYHNNEAIKVIVDFILDIFK